MTLTDSIDEFRNSPRLRILTYVCVLILAAYGVAELHDANARSRETLSDMQIQVRHLRSLSGETEWLKRVEDSRLILGNHQARAWNERSLGLAEAAYKDFLGEQLRAAGLTARELSVTTFPADRNPGSAPAAPPLPEGFAILRARLQMDMKRDSLFNFLAAIRTSQHPSSVVRLVLGNPSQRTGQVELELEALARESAAEPEGAR